MDLKHSDPQSRRWDDEKLIKLTEWLQRHIVISWVVIAMVVGIGTFWALDREPPFVLHNYTVMAGSPGATVVIEANVSRDIHRNCSAELTRYLVDSAGTPFVLPVNSFMSAQAIADVERSNPGKFRIPITIPLEAKVGQARVKMPIQYTCNIMHKIRPVSVLLDMELNITRPPYG